MKINKSLSLISQKLQGAAKIILFILPMRNIGLREVIVANLYKFPGEQYFHSSIASLLVLVLNILDFSSLSSKTTAGLEVQYFRSKYFRSIVMTIYQSQLLLDVLYVLSIVLGPLNGLLYLIFATHELNTIFSHEKVRFKSLRNVPSL